MSLDQRQYLQPRLALPRHRHALPYAAVVLSGGYEEAGDAGRRRLGPGDVVLHGAFEAHLDRTDRTGAQVLNLSLTDALTASRFGVISDPDALVRAAEKDPDGARALLLEALRPAPPSREDWTDDLAASLEADPGLRLADRARAYGITCETLSRGFRRTFGTTPVRFRLEARTREAWRQVVSAPSGLARIAIDCGFADQAHMTRAIRALTGRSPGAWRVNCVQDRA